MFFWLRRASLCASLSCACASESQRTQCFQLLHSIGIARFSGKMFARSRLTTLLRQARAASTQSTQNANKKTSTTMLYIASATVLAVGASYAAVPLYRLFCQSTGYGGTVNRAEDTDKIREMTPVADRRIRVKFNASTSATMSWKFYPQQREITVVPGETALAFFTAENPTDHAITGISTYNVLPFDAGQYFNKIQCFCFEEQRLNPHEEVDMPVFFYLDPEFAEDPALARVEEITLSYTFFKAQEQK
eukprot:m.10494 g.10494  ORF g.10494 m.10494 type:complete len:248 (-) comp5613_c1_seq1:25-768(-)